MIPEGLELNMCFRPPLPQIGEFLTASEADWAPDGPRQSASDGAKACARAAAASAFRLDLRG